MIITKHIRSIFTGKNLVLLLFMCITADVSAQTEVIDTVVTYDEDAPKEYTSEEKEQASYFLQKKPGENFSSQQRNVSGKTLKEIKEDDDFWYANENNTKKKTKPIVSKGQKGSNGKTETPPGINEKKVYDDSPAYKPVGQRGWFKTFMWILTIAGFTAIVGWYLASSNVGFFRKKDKKTDDIVIDEEMPEDIFAINYQKEIDKAAADGNYRLAIRLQYLRLLKQMAERNILSYKQDKTNFDYLVELQPSSHYNHFFRITRNYEYSWYGKFDVSNEAYHIISNDFDNLGRQINY